MSKLKLPVILVLVILIIDQSLKFWIKTHMYLGQEYRIIGDWFIIHFTENNGMAFGWEVGGEFGKMLLSVFRLIAIGFIGYYIYLLAKKGAPKGMIVCISLIFAGAIGNLIDSALYGILFNDSLYQISNFLPRDGGYAGFLYGKVVDMLYFPVIKGHFPDWFPLWGSDQFIFFRPVFNIADSSITIGVFVILIFQRKYLRHEFVKEPAVNSDIQQSLNSNNSNSTPISDSPII
jgi:signal peptidase II